MWSDAHRVKRERIDALLRAIRHDSNHLMVGTDETTHPLRGRPHCPHRV
jgi:hypothetical protein